MFNRKLKREIKELRSELQTYRDKETTDCLEAMLKAQGEQWEEQKLAREKEAAEREKKAAERKKKFDADVAEIAKVMPLGKTFKYLDFKMIVVGHVSAGYVDGWARTESIPCLMCEFINSDGKLQAKSFENIELIKSLA